MGWGGYHMNKVNLINPDYTGNINVIRHACRGIVVKGENILIGYQKNIDKYIIPGGGIERRETLEECCIREVLEETGVICYPQKYYLEIEELFMDMKHINHYFICDVVEETSNMSLTNAEKEVGLTYLWMPIHDAINIFKEYEKYRDTDVAIFGLYRREFLAIKSYLEYIYD
jgi:ADP-ribose pyrophosphatase YjhB (NUDIX family)